MAVKRRVRRLTRSSSRLREKHRRWAANSRRRRLLLNSSVALLEPSPGERIYDPCFGTGGLLSAAAGRLHDKALRMPPRVWADVQRKSVFGVEVNSFAYSIGLARVVLAGIDHPGLELGDALERPLAKDRSSEGSDCILAVPPWGGRVRPEVGAHFPIAASGLRDVVPPACNGIAS